MAELKPCPFCGDDEIEIVMKYDEKLLNVYHRVYCYGCGATMAGHLHREIAIARWNRRYTPSEIDITPFEVGDTIHIPLPKDKKIMTYNGVEIDFDYEAED